MIAKLEMFLAVAKEEHFGRAAESLGITQPTLSTGIRQLEESLGVQLIFRGHRYGGLTPEGQRALVWARSLVSDARTFREEMRAARHGLSGHIRMAVIPTALTWAATLVGALRRSASERAFLDSLAHIGGDSRDDGEPRYRRGAVLPRQRTAWPGGDGADLPGTLCAGLPGRQRSRRA
jgi:DNA-binding transcriptional LysR family regulator